MSRFLRRFKLQPDCAGTIAVVTRVTLRIVRQTRLEKVVKLTSFDEEERARPALAYWLKRHGFTPTVVERAPEPRYGGYKVDIRGAALDVAQRMVILA